MSAFRVILLGVWLMIPSLALGAGSWAEMYSSAKLAEERPRLADRVTQIYSKGIEPILSATERGKLKNLQLEFPLIDSTGNPLNFYAHGKVGKPFVAMPALSLMFVEDLSTAYAWLHKKGYSLETIDEYVTMLKYKRAGDFPGGRYPSPLTALRIPADATRDTGVLDLSLRLRNSAWAFILAHELGHIVLEHPGYDGIPMAQARSNEAAADRLALDVMRRASTIPMGAILFFQAQAYMMPNPGQFKAEGKTVRDWEASMRAEMTHPLTPDRLHAMALGLDSVASQETRGAERETLQYIATRLANMSQILQDTDLQQCMALAAYRARPDELTPRPPGSVGRFLEKCVK